MNLRRYAAIDIGSNAVRLMISNVLVKENKTYIKKVDLIRAPIRLGEDVFLDGKISEKNVKRMIYAMKSYKYLMKVHNVEKYRAFATSAMREATNGLEVVKKIKKESSINIEIIDGKEEAQIIFSTKLSDLIKQDKSYIYVDVGGGSTEITIFSKGELKNSKSFKIGTVRLLKEIVKEEEWVEMEKWIKSNAQNITEIEAIGSGGNINKIHKMSGKAAHETLSQAYLSAQINYLSSFTYEQRIEEFGLNEDRSDVIIPATQIYLSAMKWSRAKRIHVPKIGLVDGIIQSICAE